MAALAQEVAVDAALVAGIERVERRGVARGVGEHQVLVARVRRRSGRGHRPQVCERPAPRAIDACAIGFAQRVGGSGTKRGVHAGNGFTDARDRRRRQDAHRDRGSRGGRSGSRCVSFGVGLSRSKRVICTYDYSWRPWPVPIFASGAGAALGGHLAARGRRAVRRALPHASLARFSAIAPLRRRPAARRARRGTRGDLRRVLPARRAAAARGRTRRRSRRRCRGARCASRRHPAAR